MPYSPVSGISGLSVRRASSTGRDDHSLLPRLRILGRGHPDHDQRLNGTADSGVISRAHRINAGRPSLLQGMNDFFLFPRDDTEATAA